MHLIRKIALGAVFAASMAQADGHTITVSSNSTPLDKSVLTAVATEAFARNGFEFQLVSYPSERSLRMANAGEVDGEGLRVAGLQNTYSDLIQVEEPIVGISFVAFSADPSMKVSGWGDLEGKRVAFINGWKLLEAQTEGNDSVTKVDSAEQMFNMLIAGRIDLALYTLADGRQFIHEADLQGVYALEPSLRDLDLFLYLHKSHSDLAVQLKVSIQEMKADGTYDQLLAEILPQ